MSQVTLAPNAVLGQAGPLEALGNLVTLHHLPQLQSVYVTRSSGHVVIDIALTDTTAESWRAAVAAPAFAPLPRPHYSHWRTSVLWMGAELRLHYAAP